ncbi:MAG TPA: Rieske 2Fe-2S domain-containing protein [Gemmatimonadales bacterium]|nr:Rieske 2Fe-2S domain-containing protein [Gemmatimonadales bacterium]
MADEQWIDLGPAELLKSPPLRQVTAGRTRIALSWTGGKFHAVSGVCNHAGGPLGEGRLEGDFIVCPWHQWKFRCDSGVGEPGYEGDKLPCYALREEGGHLFVNPEPVSRRQRQPHEPHPLTRPLVREPGPIRVLGIATTNMDLANPRYSTSDALLETALAHAPSLGPGISTKLIRLRDLAVRPCEGYYSKSAHACTWPCSITQMDPTDQMAEVYEATVFWADVILVSTPIRWGGASALYYKMVERMNCIQNQITLRNRVLMTNKVAAFIITGGQDNVQAVAGQMLGFFAELGVQFPPFPYIAHSRGWSAEDMERNIAFVQQSTELHEAARELVGRAVETVGHLLATGGRPRMERAGRKASGAEQNMTMEMAEMEEAEAE